MPNAMALHICCPAAMNREEMLRQTCKEGQRMTWGWQLTRGCLCKASVGEGTGDDAAIRAPEPGGMAASEPLAGPQEWPPAKASGHNNAVAICAAALHSVFRDPLLQLCTPLLLHVCPSRHGHIHWSSFCCFTHYSRCITRVADAVRCI